MKKTATILFLTVLICLTTIPCLAHQPEPPMERLRAGIQKVITILGDPQYSSPAQKDEMSLKICKTIKSIFDFHELSKRSIGRPWHKFTPEEKEKFVALFTELLERTYLNKIKDYSGEKIVFDKETITKKKYAQVDTRLITGNQDIPIFYRLKLKDGEWNVYDIKIEGISLVNNYKTQFAGILDTSSDAKFSKTKNKLFARLEQKCEELSSSPIDTKNVKQ